MRILYYDIDTLRADHLGCYGYCRATSPNMDRIASEGVRFDRCHISDAPCLPSRASLFTGRFGIHTGVVNHGGTAADLRVVGPERGFRLQPEHDSWMSRMRKAGFYTVSFSPFAERHSAWWFYHGFREMHNTGKGGGEIATEVVPQALEWLRAHGSADHWFLHVNVWDPHTPYRTPPEYGNRFEGQPLDGWLTEQTLRAHWDGYGSHSPQDLGGFGPGPATYPRAPSQIASLDDYRRWIDGYDMGIWFADLHLGMILEELERLGVLEETAILISSDHSENQGELNVYGDHQTADLNTTRVPLIIRWPGLPGGRSDGALHYATDMAASVLELVGVEAPPAWDGRSFAGALRAGGQEGREFTVSSNCAWSCQRAVRWGDWTLLRTYHDGLKDLRPIMLYNVAEDPHLLRDLREDRPDLVSDGLAKLELWTAEMMAGSPYEADPMWNVIREGGPYHTRGRLAMYCERLRQSGRAHHADALMARHKR